MARKAYHRVGTTRLTKRYKRKRMAQPSSLRKGSFRTIRIGKGKKAIIGKSKRTGKMKLQSIFNTEKKRSPLIRWLFYFALILRSGCIPYNPHSAIIYLVVSAVGRCNIGGDALTTPQPIPAKLYIFRCVYD